MITGGSRDDCTPASPCATLSNAWLVVEIDVVLHPYVLGHISLHVVKLSKDSWLHGAKLIELGCSAGAA